MRHFFLSLAAASAALLCGIGTAHAVPAKPGLIQVTQSDGTQLTVRLVGDERRHYMLSPEGYTLTGGPDGDLYYAELSASGKLVPTKVKARPVNALTADERAVVSRLGKELKPTYVKPMNMPAPQQTQAPVLPAAGKPAPPRRITSAQTTGRLKSLIILVESSDKKFASASCAATPAAANSAAASTISFFKVPFIVFQIRMQAKGTNISLFFTILPLLCTIFEE